MHKVETLRELQKVFQAHTGVRDYSAVDGVSPGICHQVAREEFIEVSDFIQATDSHTCMGGASNALTWGVGATEYANLVSAGFTFVKVPESIRFELSGSLNEGCTAKDVILHILADHARKELTLNRSMEFGGLVSNRCPLTSVQRFATWQQNVPLGRESVKFDDILYDWMEAQMPHLNMAEQRQRAVAPDEGAHYHGGVHHIDLSSIRPMVAHPGNPDEGIPSDLKPMALTSMRLAKSPLILHTEGHVRQEKSTTLRTMPKSVKPHKHEASLSRRVLIFTFNTVQELSKTLLSRKDGTNCSLMLVSNSSILVVALALERVGVSMTPEQVTVSAINRNFQGRSYPGKLYLASPLTVAMSAFSGTIRSWELETIGD